MSSKFHWPIWTVYAVCLVGGIGAMLWLTSETNKLERFRQQDRAQVEQARREAELQERVSSALWKMDTMLTPLVAQEATRSFAAYASFLPSPGSKFSSISPKAANSPELKQIEDWAASPLLTKPNEFVQLHFQIEPDGSLSSPQVPLGDQLEQAVACGVSVADVDENNKNLSELASFCRYETALANCPVERVPAEVLPLEPWQQGQAVEDFVKKNLPANRVFAQNPSQQSASIEHFDNSASQQALRPATEENQNVVEAQRSRIQQRQTQELDNRNEAAQSYALNVLGNSLISNAPAEAIQTGIMRPFWLGNHLLMARRVDRTDGILVQGCWLDWESLESHLRQAVSDVLPNLRLRAVSVDLNQVPSSGRMLATLPVELVVDEQLAESLNLISPQFAPNPWTSSQVAIWAGWLGLFCAAIASGVLLNGLIRLSERRAAFVSAVSHELRSPLTTFQLYSEMLADNLVGEEKRTEYAQTLKSESWRLATLVENVLQFARLEKGKSLSKPGIVKLGEILGHATPRLSERAIQSKMQLQMENDPQLANEIVRADVGGVERILFNLVENACKYAATAADNRIIVKASRRGALIAISVQDFGPGVSRPQRKQLFHAFCKSDQQAAETAPGVGLGLALCRRIARAMGGNLYLEDAEQGARFVLEIPRQS